ncbi:MULTISPECIES: F0F1 ATP synthase subunit delta [Ferrimonas]|uniref:ATP synthase subunit delta n=1 Tax=Ferrimonas sediminum TaxID=718193 RepID=A0A1G9A5Y2_9GAMM|nr:MULTISPECIES: F0F1 ATP synthase subunit delta [Ferrimonas]USD37629.1 F0F1 ATP synthase subunit delta [Ferrimonas sp. SCSIO 43195]SDK22703.1 ATP synthase F1 subcomplex delta subunit [Ferrimonas sediminum]
MSELTTVARPYAKAAFEFAVERQAIDEWQNQLDFAAAVAQNDAIADLLSGAVGVEQLAEIFLKICEGKLNDHGQNLIKVMAENGRLAVLPQVATLYKEFADEQAKLVEAHVVSATELSEQQQQKIAESLEQKLARKVKLICSVDPQLIAGVVINAGDLVIDGSVRGKLNRMADTLQS